jgi:hypothetical protein
MPCSNDDLTWDAPKTEAPHELLREHLRRRPLEVRTDAPPVNGAVDHDFADRSVGHPRDPHQKLSLSGMYVPVSPVNATVGLGSS